MSDRFPAAITLGGTMTRTTFIRLFLALKNEHVSFNYGESSLPDTPAELLNLLSDGVLVLTDAEAHSGQFEDLEEFCRSNGIAYSRQSEAKYEYDGEIVWWKPGMEAPQITLASQSGTPLVPVDGLEDILNESKDLAADLRKYVADNTPAEVPALEVTEDGVAWDRWGEVDLDQ